MMFSTNKKTSEAKEKYLIFVVSQVLQKLTICNKKVDLAQLYKQI